MKILLLVALIGTTLIGSSLGSLIPYLWLNQFLPIQLLPYFDRVDYTVYEAKNNPSHILKRVSNIVAIDERGRSIREATWELHSYGKKTKEFPNVMTRSHIKEIKRLIKS